jgi:hypothetical protein
MASTKISALPAASTLTGAETIPLVQGGVTKKVTTDQFLTAANPSYTGTLTGGTGVVNLGSGQFYKAADGKVGVGTVSPVSKVHVEQYDYATAGLTFSAVSNTGRKYQLSMVTGGNFALTDTAAAAQRFVVDTSGNLGLGVTPSGWTLTSKAVQLGAIGFLENNSDVSQYIGRNMYRAAGGWTYSTSSQAQLFGMEAGGGFHWYTAPSGTAGNAVSLTQAMTLDSAGDLTTTNGRINLITVGRGGGGVASNTASGVSALYSNTTGVNNTANGVSALQSNTTGNYNTASGYAALYYNTTGVNNTANGVSALQSNTTGNYNTASGYAALYYNTTGVSNTASGYAALYSNTTGNYNTANGVNALYYNTTGANNTASGYAALQSNTTGNYNTASGVSALNSNTTGYSNTASGYAALYYNTTGYNNTASGCSSGYNPDNDIAQYRITTDFDMTLVGYGATKDNVGQLWNSTAIGARAKVTKSNQVVLGDSNVTETLVNGDLVQKVSTTAATLDTNGTLTFSIVDNSTLRVSVRGSDGTTRTATLALT